ncbi:hypothetical protein ACPPTR_09020 [Ralstonia pseudosolanacearum]|uniref:hypothetical protein n=1 Tax=Ralstonia pseudosolanacearum TaxID=1310165 RepID=UPI000B92F772|nr:hypothetical protein [Ralstonia pseudosolanacearum]MCD9228628.1 hypothetical protein [Ralstonia pseudosolanacearum]
MQVTFILKGLTDAFYNGSGDSVRGLLNMTDAEKFAYLCKNYRDFTQCSMKTGSGHFRDAVELNTLRRKPCRYTFKLEPRKGYKLATFDVEAA